MPNNNGEKSNRKISKDHRILAKNSMFSIIFSYSNYFTAMVTSFLMARLISRDDWGFLIISLSYINIVSLILGFLPPAIGYCFNYYIPRYLALNHNTKLKSFIRISFYIRFFFAIIVFMISILLFVLFSGLFSNLQDYTNLLFILSPLIIINSIDKESLDINRSFNLFSRVLLFVTIKNILYIGALVYCFLFITNITLEIIALVSLISALIPFFINIFLTFVLLKKRVKKTEEEKLSIKEVIKNLSFYGGQISIQSFLIRVYEEFQIQSIGTLEGPNIVTGFNIADHYRQVSTGSVGSVNQPLLIAYSNLYSTKKYKKIETMYQIYFHYSLFIILLITGFLYFLGPLFLYLIYGESFLTYNTILRLMIIGVIFGVQGAYFNSLIKASDKVKYLIPFTIVMVIIKTLLFLFGLLFFGIIGALIGFMIGSITGFILTAFLNSRFFNIKLKILKTILQYFIFFISLLISLMLGILFLNDLNYFILENLNLIIFKDFEFLSLFVFLFIFFLLTIVFKIITLSDIENIESLFDKDKKLHKIIRKGLNILKRFVRK